MKNFFLFLLIFACMASNAQTIVKGDMNDDGAVDVSDVTMTVSTILGNTPIQTINLVNNPYEADNSAVVGTWWKTKYESITFGEDGTTNVEGADTYAYQPLLGRIVFYKSGIPITLWTVVDVSVESIYINPAGSASILSYTKAVPVQLVSAITLSSTYVTVDRDNVSQLTATISPTDADNPSVFWSSSNESVATVSSSGLVTAVSIGRAIITCSAADGSGMTAICRVDVPNTEYVDLDLPSGTLWATCNIGAFSPEGYGDYFAWGETVPYSEMDESNNQNYSHTGSYEKRNFRWKTYKWCGGSENTLTKYCFNTSYGTIDNKSELEFTDDAAYVNWGSNWRMPSKEQFNELINSSYTTFEWTSLNGKNGCKITSKTNGNSIFFPAAGRREGSLIDEKSLIESWSRTLDLKNTPTFAWHIAARWSGVGYGTEERCFGLTVRPVRLSE